MLHIPDLPKWAIPIVLTGGPGSGKTEFLGILEKQFLGKLVVVPESSRPLLENLYAAPVDEAGNPDPELVKHFQTAIFHNQYCMEGFWAQKQMNGLQRPAKMPVLCDRGLFDGGCYLPGGIDQLGSIVGGVISGYYSRYSLVICFQSVATILDDSQWKRLLGKGRFETREQALALDPRFMEVWAGHPNLHFIKASDDPLAKFRQARRIILDHCKNQGCNLIAA